MNLQQIQSIMDRIVEDMAFLSTQEAVDPESVERLRELAVVYSELVRDFHHRLEFCQELLQRNQSREAMAKAKEEPDLRELLRILNFRELAGWKHFCEELSLPLPPPIRDDASLVISDVYQIRQVLDQLLRRQRHLVLQLAGKRDRLAILRQLSMLDSSDKLWRRDILALEKARKDELAGEIDEAVRTNDLKELQAIRMELMSDDWAQKPPRRAIAEVEKRIQPLLHENARQRIIPLVTKAKDARDKNEEATARQTVQKIHAICQEVNLPLSDSVVTPLQDVQEWLEELDAERLAEQQWKKQCQTLRQAIERGEKQQDIEKMIVMLQADSRGIPPDLIASTNLYLQKLDQRRRKMGRLRVAVIIAVVLLIGAGSAYLIRRSKFERAVLHHCDQAQTLVARKDWNKAGELFDYLQTNFPKLRNDPRIQAEYTSYKKKKEEDELQEKIRVQKFNDAKNKVIDKGLDEPDKASLNEMGKLAKTDEEFKAFEDLRDKISHRQIELIEIDKQRRTEQAKKFQTCYGEIDKVLHELQDVVSKDPVNPELYDQKLKACRQAQQNGERMIPLTKEQSAKLAETKTLINEIAEQYEKDKRKDKDIAFRLKSIWLSYTDVDKLEKTMKEFTTTYPDHPCTAGFRRTLGRMNVIRSLVAWDDMMRKWKSPTIEKGTQAVTRLKELTDYCAAHPVSPVAESVDKLTKYYHVAEKAFPAGATEMTGFSAVSDAISRPVLLQLWLVKTKRGITHYYISYKAHKINDRVMSYTLMAVKDIEGNVKKKGITPDEIGQGECLGRRAPVSLLLQELNKEIQHFQTKDWATIYLDMASIVYKRKTVNPCARGQLMLLLLNQAAQTVPVAADKIARQVNNLDQLGIADLNWLVDSGEETEVARTKTTRLLNAMTDPAEYAKEIRKSYSSLSTIQRYSPVGIVTDPAQRIKLPSGCSFAYVLVSDSPPRMVKVTPEKDGYLYPKKENLLTPGTILFGSR